MRQKLHQLPFWDELDRLSRLIAVPVHDFAALVLKRYPWLDRFEWLLETRSLTRRSPVAIALPMLLCAWRGLATSEFGHIGTDIALYPLIAATSSFNPFLAVCCAITFGAADIFQKLLFNDIYGAESRFGLDYWGAIIGYVIAYSAVLTMALAAGITTRLFRSAFLRLAYAAIKADGADLEGNPSLGQEIASMAGSFVGAAATMYVAAPVLEWPAFHLRPNPDVSCFDSEVQGLHAAAPLSGISGAAGAALGGATPGLVDRPYHPWPDVKPLPTEDVLHVPGTSSHIPGDTESPGDSHEEGQTKGRKPSELYPRSEPVDRLLLDPDSVAELEKIANLALKDLKHVIEVAKELPTPFDRIFKIYDAVDSATDVAATALDGDTHLAVADTAIEVADHYLPGLSILMDNFETLAEEHGVPVDQVKALAAEAALRTNPFGVDPIVMPEGGDDVGPPRNPLQRFGDWLAGQVK